MHDTTGRIRPKRLSYAVSVALASLMAGHAALAQDTAAPQQTPQQQGQPTSDTAVSTESGITRVVVSTRRSQQSSIERKKNAATAIDSIVAEDVGSLPDRNVGEALSRMAGVALDRGEYGEGVSVAVRGNESDVTRVELDGQAVQSAGGSDLNGGGDGRGTEFRQLSADLIKSVDVIKGSTADMTEGSLGGGIRIETRTGLDFVKPFVSIRAAATQNSLGKKWTPDLNLIASKKYLDNRLGVLVNASVYKVENEAHQTQTSSNGNQAFTRSVDIDGSPEKTYSFQPGSLDMTNPISSAPLASYSNADTGFTWNSATPIDLLTRAGAAQTKQDCFTQFPQLSNATGTISPEIAGLSNANRTSAVNQRANELMTCLNQWNDYTPSLIRSFVKNQIDERKNLDLRLDFKVNNELTVFAKGSYSRRRIEDNYLTLNLGNLAINGNLPGTETPGYVDVNGQRVPVAGSGNYFLPNSWSGANLAGAVVDFDPATAVVDSTHHLVQYTVNNAGVNVDQSRGLWSTNARYLQLGGKYKTRRLTLDAFVADGKSDFSRGSARVPFSFLYGPATITHDPSGAWKYTFPNGAPQLANPDSYLRPTVQPGGAVASTAPTVTFDNPKAGDTSERTAKLDLSYAVPDSIPFFRRIKSGVNVRDVLSASWAPAGYTVTPAVGVDGQPGYVPAVTVPNAASRQIIQGCYDTAASLSSGGTPCVFGYIPAASPSRSGTYTMPMEEYRNLLAATLNQQATATSFFNGVDGRPDGLIDNWQRFDVFKVANMLNLPNFNYDCLKRCLGSDGQMYDQPVNKVKEKTEALYLMADFTLDHLPFTERSLPFGLELEGNFGYRYVRTTVQGTGNATFISIRRAPDYTLANPVTISSTVTRPSTINAVNHVFLPSYNLATWVVPDKAVVRYSAAKTSTRPPVSRLTATGRCTYDETNLNDVSGDQEESMTCETFGNPDLRGQSNFNQNLSLELYPNKDTMFSIAGYKQEGRVGGYETVRVSDVPVFAGSSEVDPATGKPLADLLFDYNTYRNGPVATRKGIEFSLKTAFSFLPGVLRNTGLDANATRQNSKVLKPYVDPITGMPLPPRNESKLSYNWALWFDDGKFTARVAVQMVGESFRCLAPCSGGTLAHLRQYPTPNTNGSVLPWNAGAAQWRDRRTFVDGKLSYKFNKNFDIFVEGRNLGKVSQSDSLRSVEYSDGPFVSNYAYSGRRITIGMNYRNL